VGILKILPSILKIRLCIPKIHLSFLKFRVSVLQFRVSVLQIRAGIPRFCASILRNSKAKTVGEQQLPPISGTFIHFLLKRNKLLQTSFNYLIFCQLQKQLLALQARQ